MTALIRRSRPYVFCCPTTTIWLEASSLTGPFKPSTNRSQPNAHVRPGACEHLFIHPGATHTSGSRSIRPPRGNEKTIHNRLFWKLSPERINDWRILRAKCDPVRWALHRLAGRVAAERDSAVGRGYAGSEANPPQGDGGSSYQGIEIIRRRYWTATLDCPTGNYVGLAFYVQPISGPNT